MFFWFVGLSLVVVWMVFRSPAVDYRLIVLGALLPLVELPFGEPRFLHSLAAPVLFMVLIMVVARGRRLRQRQLVGVPIGLFLHLVLDGAWADTTAFWWPFAGFGWSEAELYELARGGWNLVLELAGLAALWWCWQTFRLSETPRRQRFLRSGRLAA